MPPSFSIGTVWRRTSTRGPAHCADDVDRGLKARPSGPGVLLFATTRGQELYEVGNTGPRLLVRRGVAPDESAALDRAGRAVVDELATSGVKACTQPIPNRIAVALLAGPDAMDLTESRWMPQCGFTDRAEFVGLVTKVAIQAGLAEPRVRCGDRLVEIGLTDTCDALVDVVDMLSGEGIGPGLMLLIGGDFAKAAEGESDSLLIRMLERATVVSVARAHAGEADGVRHLGGGLTQAGRLLDEQLHRIAVMRVPNVDDDPAWTIRESGTDEKLHRVNETLFTIGAGGFATRGTLEEPSPLSVPMVLAAGVYQGTGAEQHPLPGPQWTELAIAPAPREDIRVLDLRTGVLYREETPADGPPFRSLRLASLDLPGLVAMRAEGASGRLHATVPLRPPGSTTVTEGTVDGRHWMRVGSDGSGGIGAVAEQRLGRDGERRTVERVAAFVADPRHQPALPGAHVLVDTARQHGFDRLLAEHRAAWAARWDAVDVRIPDDPDVERDIRFALFQLWCNTGRYDELPVGARGLSGSGYAGHVFWDADVFVLPALVTIDPRAAEAMITYRLHRLDAAKVLALATGRAGARFPWESAATGEDVTPAFGRLGGKSVPILTGPREEHITADVAWAAVHCATWTGQAVTAASREWPLLRETARYWASRCRRDPDGAAHIDEVIGPDEYHELVDDNAFTNVMARWNLRTAADVGEQIPDLADECQEWRKLAAAIVDGYNPSTKLYEQFAGYFDLEPLRVTDFYPPPVAADVVYPRERIARSQSIKQADVLMIHHMIPDEAAPGSLGPNLDFYGPRTTHGSSLSPAITAALLARAGQSDNALSMLRLALGVDLKDLNGTTAGGLHLATLGGIWQAVLVGFLGVRLSGETLCLDPDLPSAWRTLEARFICRNRRVRVQVRPGAVDVTTDGPLWVQLAGREARHVTGRVSLDR